MRDMVLSAVHLLAALGKSPEPMTIHELKGSVDDAAVLPLLIEAGYVVRHDGRFSLNCDPAKLSLFELNELFSPYECSEDRDFADLFEESLKDMTAAWMMELEKPKPVTRRDVEMFRDCLRRIEQKTGEKFPSHDIEEIMKDIA